MIPYGKQSISQLDIDSVVEVMRSGLLTQGAVVPEFESRISNYCASLYAVSTNNATSALHLACLALGVAPGDIVWTSPITFVASANCAKYCGASIDFVDVEPNTGLMSVASLEEKLLLAAKRGSLPKVIIPVHYSGQSCDMVKISLLATKYGIKVIEDASHALGATYLGSKIGSCKYSDVCIFSFHPVKMITTAEGGMALTNNEVIAKIIRKLKNHGIVQNSAIAPWYYEQQELGFNYRMPDLLAALGISQLQQLDTFLIKRRQAADYYYKNIDSEKLETIYQHEYGESSYHLFPILLKNSQLRLELYDLFLAHGIKCQVHYIPVYKQPHYNQAGSDHYSGSESFYQRELSIPIFVDITAENLKTIIKLLNSF